MLDIYQATKKLARKNSFLNRDNRVKNSENDLKSLNKVIFILLKGGKK